MMNFDELVGLPAGEPKKPITMVRQEQVDKILAQDPPVLLQPEKKMINWFDQHYYQVGENFYPSVTTILQASPRPELMFWRGNVGNEEASRIMKEAGERGSIIHNIFSAMLKGKKAGYRVYENSDTIIPVNDQFIQLALWKLVRFMEIVSPKVHLSEEIVYSKAYEYAGTMDLLFEVDGGSFNVNGAKPIGIPAGIYVADIKSGKNIDDEAYWQTAAYAKAYTEMTGTKINGTLILHTQSQNKGGIEGFGVKIRTEEEMETDFSNFLKIYQVWKIKPYPSKPKLITDLPEILSLNNNKTKE